MSKSDSVNRRQFLETSSFLAAAAAAVGGAREASAQLNNSAAVNLTPVRLGFIGVGIRGTLLMEAAAGIAGVEIKAAADCYGGHLDATRELITPAPEVTGDYKAILSRPDVLATPHTAGLTLPAIEHQSLETVEQARAIVAGRVPRGAVNAEHWRRRLLG